MPEPSPFLNLEKQKITMARYAVYGFLSEGNYIVPPFYQPKRFEGDTLLWILPEDPGGKSLMILCGGYTVRHGKNGSITVSFDGSYTTTEYPGRPACDFFGNFVRFDIDGGPDFETAYARFYWDNLLPEIAERTFMVKKKDIRDGYVLSTLKEKVYGGTYPAVDHEFHIKGRFAVGGAAEASLVRRMLELQLKIMREDKKQLSRNVCSVQPNRRREYDVWRRSRNLVNNAQMFRITANVEFVEALFLYYSMTKDIAFVRDNIEATEKNCAYIERFIGEDWLLDSHVYFEDQVIKDGKVAQAQCFAVNSFRLMARLETLLGRDEKAAYYGNIAEKLGESIPKDFPAGYWDKDNKRFIDWIDGAGKPHDHIHLLANELPSLLALADEEQQANAAKAIEEHRGVFSKFPSYVAAKIEDYTNSEIGTGGPYDLCAAGRYWCWDARYKAFMNDGAALKTQLGQVSEQAKLDGYFMGERYDMNYVYYVDDKNWHGAALYYEYPNVFLYVLVTQYLGVSFGFDCDLAVKPLLTGEGAVRLPAYGIEYSVKGSSFTLQNLKDTAVIADIDLTGIGINFKDRVTLEGKGQITLPKKHLV